jgi:hypothetical protein
VPPIGGELSPVVDCEFDILVVDVEVADVIVVAEVALEDVDEVEVALEEVDEAEVDEVDVPQLFRECSHTPCPLHLSVEKVRRATDVKYLLHCIPNRHRNSRL